MKWKMNKNINNPPAADAAAIELPAATWSRNHSGKLLHYYIRQIKHKKTLPKMIRSDLCSAMYDNKM